MLNFRFVNDCCNKCVSFIINIQLSVLDEAAHTHPNCWWWIKTDGCDLVSGLGESVRGEWSRDVDLNDGAVQKLYTDYRQQLDFVTSIGAEGKSDHASMKEDLQLLKQRTLQDVNFVTTSECGYTRINVHYASFKCSS